MKGRAVIVAGSSEGIGLAAARRFAAEGARLAVCSRDAVKLNAAAETLRGECGAEVFAEPVDVASEAAVNAFVGRVAERFGGVDVCVANAGGPPPRQFLATTGEEWRQAVETNLLSVVHLARAVLPAMQRAEWGRIVTITSVSVRQPIGDLIYSNTVRAGVLGLVRSLANEFGKDGITVNNVGPGFTATRRLRQLAANRAAELGIGEADYFARIAADVPLKRIGQPEEIADAIVWLCSERASYISGQTVLVDGGLYKGL